VLGLRGPISRVPIQTRGRCGQRDLIPIGFAMKEYWWLKCRQMERLLQVTA
jgi:hypothetical protein